MYRFTAKIILLLFVPIIFSSSSCTSQNKGNMVLAPAAFEAKMRSFPGSPILDVRSPEEFEGGYIKGALNADWNGDDFEKISAGLNKEIPVFVYCLSGGRSSSAASHLRKTGFKTVYELDGGMMSWRAAGMPETGVNSSANNGMSESDFKKICSDTSLVLVDFYADWCVPCQKMKPYLEEISVSQQNKVKVTRINADENRGLCTAMKVDALPVLQLYRNGKLLWEQKGYIEKEAVLQKLNSFF